MMKFSAIVLNALGFLFFGLFSAADIVVENNTPTTIEPGAIKEVTIKVNKGNVQGFSKLELTLPFGFTATPGNLNGASFTFSGQKAKFVWMTLPVEESFTVSYFIQSAENLEGIYNISGIFSYVKENKREDINIPSRDVEVKKRIGPTPEEVAATMPNVKIEPMVADMFCERTVEKLSDTQFKITLRVKNNQIKNLFGRILETVPFGCNTEAVNDAGATVTQLANTIKFVWFQTPDADEFDCSYLITCTDASITPEISGVFSYTLEQVPYEQIVINQGEPYVAPYMKRANGNLASNSTNNNSNNTTNNKTGSNNATADNNSSSNKTSNKSSKGNTNDKSVKNTTASKTNSDIQNLITSVPSPEKGITYKVQIMAAHRVVNKSYFKKIFGFTQPYNIENIDGWVKYTTGKYAEYQEARNAREELKANYAKLPGPFVTAYNDGERITVQEALLISNQQWIQ